MGLITTQWLQKNGFGRKIIWSKERAEATFFKGKKRKPNPPKVTRWN